MGHIINLQANRGRDKLSANSGYEEKAYTLEHRGSKRHPVRPAPVLPPNKVSGKSTFFLFVDPP